MTTSPVVTSVARDDSHHFSKVPCPEIVLLEGIGVEGDAHAGRTVQHRSRVAADPTQPNLRQVHLLASEFFDLAAQDGHALAPGDLGENVLTTGIDLLALPRDTRLRLGPDACVRLTGLRNPCWQIESFQAGLLRIAVTRGEDGEVVRRTGVMGVVERGGRVAPGDAVVVELPEGPHQPLDRV